MEPATGQVMPNLVFLLIFTHFLDVACPSARVCTFRLVQLLAPLPMRHFWQIHARNGTIKVRLPGYGRTDCCVGTYLEPSLRLYRYCGAVDLAAWIIMLRLMGLCPGLKSFVRVLLLFLMVPVARIRIAPAGSGMIDSGGWSHVQAILFWPLVTGQNRGS